MKLNDEKKTIISNYADEIIEVTKEATNNLIDISNDKTQICFLIARFSITVVYLALDRILEISNNANIIANLTRESQLRYKELGGTH